jgi:hypothetical protein
MEQLSDPNNNNTRNQEFRAPLLGVKFDFLIGCGEGFMVQSALPVLKCNTLHQDGTTSEMWGFDCYPLKEPRCAVAIPHPVVDPMERFTVVVDGQLWTGADLVNPKYKEAEADARADHQKPLPTFSSIPKVEPLVGITEVVKVDGAIKNVIAFPVGSDFEHAVEGRGIELLEPIDPKSEVQVQREQVKPHQYNGPMKPLPKIRSFDSAPGKARDYKRRKILIALRSLWPKIQECTLGLIAAIDDPYEYFQNPKVGREKLRGKLFTTDAFVFANGSAEKYPTFVTWLENVEKVLEWVPSSGMKDWKSKFYPYFDPECTLDVHGTPFPLRGTWKEMLNGNIPVPKKDEYMKRFSEEFYNYVWKVYGPFLNVDEMEFYHQVGTIIDLPRLVRGPASAHMMLTFGVYDYDRVVTCSAPPTHSFAALLLAYFFLYGPSLDIFDSDAMLLEDWKALLIDRF